MPNFQQITGRAVARSKQRAAKFEVKIRRIIDQAPGDSLRAGLRGADAIIKSTAAFLASFGSETVRLNKLSRQRLNEMDAVAQNKLKTRAIAELQAQSREDMKNEIEAFARGRIKQEQLRQNAQAILRRQALAAAIVGVGGVGNLSENVLSAVRRQLTQQFELLDGFIKSLNTRDVTAKDRQRAAQYTNSAHTIAQTANRQMQLDANQGQEMEERRRLGGGEHCEDCLELEGEGWQDAGSLPPIGQGTVCGNSCQCWIEVRIRSENNVSRAGEDI